MRERVLKLSDIHGDDCSGRPIRSRTEVNGTGLEELMLEKPTCDIFRLLISYPLAAKQHIYMSRSEPFN